MAWARIGDGAMSHPKLIALIDWHQPFCLWVWGLSYCSLHLTDGRIPHGAIPNKAAARTADRLVAAHLWEVQPDGYLVHDYLDWNDSRAVIVKKRLDAKDRMTRRRSREPAPDVRANNSRTFSKDVLRGVDLQNVPSTEDDRSAPNPETPVRANNDTKVVLEPSELVRWFDRVYAAYPNKDRKQAANQAWVELGPDLATAQAILADIDRRKGAGWVRFERRFIPHLVRFLVERQWEDAPDSGAFHEENDLGPYAWTCKKCGAIHEGTSDQARQFVCLKSA